MGESSEIALLMDRLMRRVGAGLHAQGQLLDQYRVGPLGGMILTTLEELQPTSLQGLVEQMARDKSQMARSVKALVTKGLVEREPSQNDRRVMLLRLTQEGSNVVTTIRWATTRVIEEVLAPLSVREQARFVALLRKL